MKHLTARENQVVADIRLRAARFELKLLKAAEKRGKLPTARAVAARSLAASLAKVCR